MDISKLTRNGTHRLQFVFAALVLVLLAVKGIAISASPAEAKSQSDREKPVMHIAYDDTVLIQLAVSDLDRAMKFYGEVLELKLSSHQSELEWAKYDTAVPGVRIGVGRQDKVLGSGSISINLGVHDLEATRALLESRGVTFTGPSVNIPGVVKLADFRDPDGNRIRLAGPPDASE